MRVRFYMDKLGRWHFSWFIVIRNEWISSGCFETFEDAKGFVDFFLGKNNWTEEK